MRGNRISLIIYGIPAILLSFLAVILSVRATILNYVFVPFWDMWSGIDFVQNFSFSNPLSLLTFHNEHIILFSKMFFLADYYFFKSSGVFLVGLNFLLAALMALLFTKLLLSIRFLSSLTKLCLTCFVFAATFSWTQEENFIWSFQSQFFLAYLLPLLAFYILTQHETNQRGAIFFSALIAIASVGTMANGLLVAPLLVIQWSLMNYAKKRRVTDFDWVFVGFLALSIVLIGLYLMNFTVPPGHGSLIQAIKKYPKELLLYIFVYLGNFPAKITDMQPAWRWSAYFGIIYVSLFGLGSIFVLLQGRANSSWNISIAAAIFCLYILMTAFVTGGGRLIFGLDQALSSRYATPSIYSWISLMVLWCSILNRQLIRILVPLGWSFLITFFVLNINFQAKYAIIKPDLLHQRTLAAIAAYMGVEDETTLKYIYPSPTEVLRIAQEARLKDLSIFFSSVENYKKIGSSIKYPSSVCQGYLEESKEFNRGNFTLIKGWIFNGVRKQRGIGYVASNGRVIGYYSVGSTRFDVAQTLGKKALFSGFRGYYNSGDLSEFDLIPEDFSCLLHVNEKNDVRVRQR